MQAPFDIVKLNARKLALVAGRLYRARSFAASVHMSIAASEETSKALIVFCQQHLPQRVFASRFSHIPKHRMAGAAYYIAGGMQTIYLLHVGIREGFLGGSSEDQRIALDYFMEIAGRGSAESVAQAVMAVLDEHTDARVEEQRRKWALDQEKDRVQSIYVDIDQQGRVTSTPERIQKDVAQKYLRQAVVCLRVLDIVNSEIAGVEEFIATLPRDLRTECYNEATRMVRHVRSAVNGE